MGSHIQGLPRGLSGKKKSACSADDPGDPDPWVRKAPGIGSGNPLFLPGVVHGQRSLAGYSPRGLKESDATE